MFQVMTQNYFATVMSYNTPYDTTFGQKPYDCADHGKRVHLADVIKNACSVKNP